MGTRTHAPVRLSRHAAHHYDHGRTYIVMGRQPHAVPHGQPTHWHTRRGPQRPNKKSRSSRVEKVPGKPPGPGGPGPTSPALSGRLSIMQRGRLGRLNDNCRRRQGLDQPGRVAVPGRAGRPPAALGRPRARPAPVNLEQDEGLARERAAAANSCARTCRPRSGRSCEQRVCRRGLSPTDCVGVRS